VHRSFAVAAALAASTALAAAGPRTFNVEVQRSRALIDVGKSGAFSFAGHTHEVEAPLRSGVIHLDADALSRSDVRLEFDASTMRVTGKGESADDVPKVTQTMLGDQVLDVKKFPRIVFESTSVMAKGSLPSIDLTVTGKLTIRDTTRPITAPVVIKVDGAMLAASGKFSIKQTDFGIKPISVGGVVKVKDELTITFNIAAREQ